MAQSFLYLTDAGGQIWRLSIDADGILSQTLVGAALPVVAGSGNAGGMSRTQIIQTVHTLTENKGSNLGLETLYIHRLQKFCAEKRFWWRKKTFYFQTLPLEGSYDLTAITTVPSSAGVEVEEFTKVVYVRSSTDLVELTPLFDDAVQLEVIESELTGEPGGFFVDPNSYQTLRFNLIPADIYKIRVTCWALPNPVLDNTNEVVPLVPGYLHHVIVDGLVMDVWRSVYGEQDPKYLTAKREYEAGVERAMAKSSFDASYAPSFKSREAAVRSTR